MKLYNLYKYKIFLYFLVCFLSFSNISNSSERLNNLWSSYYYCPNFNKCLNLINKIEKELVCIPCGWWLDKNDLKYIINEIKDFFKIK